MTRHLSGKSVVVGFLALVAVVGLGLWLALGAARDAFQAETEALRAGGGAGGVEVESAPAETGWLRVSLDTNGGGWLPFFLRILPEGGEAIIRNGEEEIEATLRRFPDGALLIDFPHYDSRLTLEPAGEGALAGVYTKTRLGGEIAEMRARAEPVGEPRPERRFPAGAGADGAAPDYSGRWRMAFAEDGPAKGIFEQDEAGALTGTILTPLGDYRFLAGNVVEGELRLSVFDGSHAFLFTGSLDEAGQTMTGEFHSGGYFEDSFSATRLSPGEDFDLLDPLDEVALEPGVTRLGIEPLQREPYDGAPTIVVIFGTWCPNCHDEAPLLKRLYDEHHEEGLQILGLAYEHTDDIVRSRRQIDRFKQRFGIEWEIIPAGVSDKEQTAGALPSISTIKSYPTTIWVNPDGTVRAIHSGFAGPATGEAWEETQALFHRLTREIVSAQ